MTYTKGWMHQQVLSIMVDAGKWISGIANKDTALSYTDVILVMCYFSGRLGKEIKWNHPPPLKSEDRENYKTLKEIVDY